MLELIRNKSCGENSESSDLPPLMDLSSDDNQRGYTVAEDSPVPCFSNQLEDPKPQNDMIYEFSNENLPYPDSDLMMQDHSILRFVLEGNGANIKQNAKPEFLHDTGMGYEDLVSAGPVDLDCLWNYSF